jgi:hypothetical protein
MEIILALITGIGLSAACGFRVFVPLLLMNLAARLGYLNPAPGFEWLGGNEAAVVFGVATALELSAYLVPWLDNALDTVATPAAVAAGIIASASLITDLPPLLKWATAVIAGGGIAGLVQGATAALRVKSSLFTGGLANMAVAALELAGSVVTAALAVLLPLAGFIVAVAMVAFILWKVASNCIGKSRPSGG